MIGRSRLLRCALGLTALLTASRTVRAQATPAPARDTARDTVMVSVDGHRMAVLVTGSGAGPTVVMEAGGGSSHRSWGGLPDEIARSARVVMYDRAGYGLSEACARPRMARVVAEELRAALRAAKIEPPFLLVGWSLGASFARVFGSLYPADVVGLVLVDPAPEEFYVRAARERPEVWNPLREEQDRRVATGPPGDRGEWAAWDSSMAQARASDRGLKAPVTLLTATRAEDELQVIWIDEHRNWAARMPRTRHVLVEGASHAIHRDRPEVVLTAIRDMLAAARQGAGR